MFSIPYLLLCAVLGFASGLAWWMWTGQMSMPPWFVIVMSAVCALIADVVENAMDARRARRARPAGPRHRKAPTP